MNWIFPSNNNGDINGIGHSGVETFQGTPLKSLAREICQNSLDAALPDRVVEVEFMKFALDVNEFPDATSLNSAFVASLDFWKKQSNKKTIDFFDRAIAMMTSGSIPFLRVSDFNTTGLQGSREEYNTPWCNLTKSSGASDKSGTSGGSFGIGKFAPYACSEFRTVFYSTLDKEGVEAYQGISRITSFRCPDNNDITVGVGYYGEADNKPVHAQLSLDSGFVRSNQQTGTDIFISGFKFFSTDWKTDIITSILDGFLYAIYTGNLVVRVGDVEICKEALSELLVEYQSDLSENADKYFTVLTSPDTVWYTEDYRQHGRIRLGLMLQGEMHRKVAMIRKTGMKIMDRGGISGIIPFAGVMLIEGEKVNDYLRTLENPEHTKWEPDRIEPKTRIPEAKSYVKGLIDYIKECLELLKQEDASDEIDPDVGEFLPDEPNVEEKSSKNPQESLADTIKSFEVSTPPRRPVSSSVTIDGDQDNLDESGETEHEQSDSGAGHGDGTSSSGGDGTGDNEGAGQGENPRERTRALSSIVAAKVRIVCLNKELGEYSIAFVPLESAEDGRLELLLSAESQNYEAPLLSAVGLGIPSVSINRNQITGLEFVKDAPVRIKATLDFDEYCSMEVKAYGYKK